MTKKILVLHGPNLNLLGIREPQHYGEGTLDDLNHILMSLATARGISLEAFQSNAEHHLVERIHHCLQDMTGFIIINPAAFTHTSIALRDALSGIQVPFIEVHLTNVYSRDSFRHSSYFSDIAVGVIAGLGTHGYELALHYALRFLDAQQ